MEFRRDSTLCSHRVPVEDDFLSRRVNQGWDADSSECNYKEDSSDFLSCDYGLLKLYSREHSREQLHEGGENSRKSSFEKPVGFLMQLKPWTYVCENFKSSFWGRYLSGEKKVCDNSQDYENETSIENIETNIVESTDNYEQQNSDCVNLRSAVHSALKRSKSVNDLYGKSSCEEDEKVDQKQTEESALKHEKKEEKSSQNKRTNAKKLNKQFSVYSQNFGLNSRFVSKSHYHSHYWNPDKSVAGLEKNKESFTNSKQPIQDVLIDKGVAYKKDNKKDTEIEEIRRKFNTANNLRSWVWEPELNSSNKIKMLRKTQKNTQNCKARVPTSKEFSSNRKIKAQRIGKNRNVDDLKDELARKIKGQSREFCQGHSLSSVTLPSILSQNVGFIRRKRSPQKLGHLPSISTEGLMNQSIKHQEENIKKKNCKQREK